jgi:hypothetical protein
MIPDISHCADLALWVYIVTSITSLYGFSLFFWWWRLGGQASEVYIYIMLLMLSNFLYCGINTYARYSFINDVANLNEYESIISSMFWQVRAIPNLVIIALIVTRMTRRAQKTMAARRRTAEPPADRRKQLRRSEDKKVV